MAAPELSVRADIEARLAAGSRLTADDAVALFGSDDLAWLGGLAHARRVAAAGAVTSYLPVADPAATPQVLTWQYTPGQPAADRVTELLALRDQPTRVFAPVRAAAGPDGHEVSPAEMLKLFAVCRLLFDEAVTIGCDLASHPESTAQLLLDFGVADLLVPADGFDPQHVAELIWDAGGTPVHRDADFGTVRDYGPATPAADRRAEPQSVFT
ncbi:hypothetical protein Athai_55740 [Actinocatenispora thailandica]|uniref:Uncharacterized protein n=1 Tax=Actinocatenispora thailandica TaxID=227318 RepID=A0A7R7DUM8_9ACTN|nr:hypothetical protein [Actinocatenispora thailandica]BCJ38071.1 hypothetical protein Athai_55740 [Actinocatenispora thailandica]